MICSFSAGNDSSKDKVEMCEEFAVSPLDYCGWVPTLSSCPVPEDQCSLQCLIHRHKICLLWNTTHNKLSIVLAQCTVYTCTHQTGGSPSSSIGEDTKGGSNQLEDGHGGWG